MRCSKAFAGLGCALAAIALAAAPAAADTKYVLNFTSTVELWSTPNSTLAAVNPGGATGTMTISIKSNGDADVDFRLRGARPNTIYTIWTVFGHLNWPLRTTLPSAYVSPPQRPLNTYYPEMNAVAPLARLDAAFTSGMGLDPGATFVTNGQGNAEIHLSLDYNLLGVEDNGPPVANKDVIVQCVPGDPAQGEFPSATGSCPRTAKSQKVTTTWLRKYIAQVMAEQGYSLSSLGNSHTQDALTALCENYDPTNPNSIYWQCIDPETGMPRVYRFPFDHFRLAAHPDDLTHGMIGGNGMEHVIDMVGRRCDVQPRPAMPLQTVTINGMSTPTDCNQN